MEVVHVKRFDKGVHIQYHQSVEKMNQETVAVESIDVDAIVGCSGVGSYPLAQQLGDQINVYPVKGYSITVQLEDENSIQNAPWVSVLDESAKIVTSRLGTNRLQVGGTVEFNGYNRDISSEHIQPSVDWVNRNFNISTEHSLPWSGLRSMMPSMMFGVRRAKR